MKRLGKVLLIGLIFVVTALAIAAGAGVWYARSKLPTRSGTLVLKDLQAPVQVRWDERGVPHIQAKNETDLYRALGFVHAQDRLFQFEVMRRLAKGELAEIFGASLLDNDRLFRTLGLRAQAERMVEQMDRNSPAWKSLEAYLDGVNEYQDTRPHPLEFDLLKIQPQPFTPADVMSITGYTAYSFAAALRTEPALTYVRDQLGANYLQVFDLDWHPEGVLAQTPRPRSSPADWQALQRVAEVSDQALTLAGLPLFEGSNAWVLSGARTRSGKPQLAGDPHIAFSLPAVWYEAHLQTPDFELYGHFQALNPYALLGHNTRFGWTLTMLQNDDMDLVRLQTNPANPKQIAYQGQWVALTQTQETIAVKDEDPVTITLQQSPYGPVINQAFPEHLGKTPVALWWTFLQPNNTVVQGFHALNRAENLSLAREAASQIGAPGVNVVWANAQGDIAWWAAAKLVQRPLGVNPSFILDSAKGEAEKPGYYRFIDNPQEENPARGYIVSANHQPVPRSGVPVPGYYNPPDRARRITQLLQQKSSGWELTDHQAIQLDAQTQQPLRILQPLLPLLARAAEDSIEQSLVGQLAEWNGQHDPGSIAPTVYHQLHYELLRAAMADEMGAFFTPLLRTRLIDITLQRLANQDDSPWWDNVKTAEKETRSDTVAKAWRATIKHLNKTYGTSLASWTWGHAHTLTHTHPLGRVKPLNFLFNVGPLEAPGGREIINNMAHNPGPGPWAVSYGPSTRRLIDFASPGKAVGINPVGQSGAWLDTHYADQAQNYLAGRYQPMHLDEADVRKSTRSTLQLQPAN